MRLREIKKIVVENLELLNYDENQHGDYMQVSNFQEAIDAIHELSQFDYINEEIQTLKALEKIFYNRTDKVVIDQNTYAQFTNALNSIKMKSQTIIDLVDEAVPEENQFSVSVKLPEYKDLSDVSRFISDLDKSLKILLVSEDVKGKVELQNFDSGSLWLEIIVGSAYAVDLLANATIKAMEVRKEYYKAETIKFQVEGYGIKNELLNKLQEATKKQLDALVKAQTQELVSEKDLKRDQEAIGKLQYSIETLARLLYEGAEIHPALNAPTEMKNEFPQTYPQLQRPQEMKELKESIPEYPSIQIDDEQQGS